MTGGTEAGWFLSHNWHVPHDRSGNKMLSFLTHLSDLSVSDLHAHLLLPSGPHTPCTCLAFFNPGSVRLADGGRSVHGSNEWIDGRTVHEPLLEEGRQEAC